MKTLSALLLFPFAAITALAQTPSTTSQQPLSPAEKSMAQANRLIAKKPQNFEAYNALALALSRRARETSDITYYTQADEALRQSFVLAPDNFDGARIQVWLL